MRAVIYARYSSERQTEQSIEGQVRVCEDYAKKNGYEIIHTYIDRAMTGRNDQRDDFQLMLRDSQKRNFEIVLVYAFDRFARNREDSAINKAILRRNGVKLVSATQKISDNPEGILLESLLEGLAEYYSVELAQKVKRGMKESAMKGHFLGGRIPYGYDVVDKCYVINQEEAEVIDKIYELYLSMKSIKSVSDWLNSNHITNKVGGKFKHHQVHNILTRPLYIGTINAVGMTLENKIPAIVDKEDFKKVQKIINNHTKINTKGDFLLTGKIFCGSCGEKMTGSSGTGRSKTYYYYVCKKDKLKINKDLVENIVLEKIREFLNNADKSNVLASNIDAYIEDNKSQSAEDYILEKIKKIDKELENITAAVLNGIINETIKTRNTSLLEEKANLEAELKDIRLNPLYATNGKEIAQFLASLAASEESREKALLIKSILHKVIILGKKVIVILNTSSNGNNTDTREIMEISLDDRQGFVPAPLGATNTKLVEPKLIIYKNILYFVIIADLEKDR